MDESGIIEGGGRPTIVLPRGTGTPVPNCLKDVGTLFFLCLYFVVAQLPCKKRKRAFTRSSLLLLYQYSRFLAYCQSYFIIFCSNFLPFPNLSIPMYEATVPSFHSLSSTRLNIRRFVTVRSTRWSGKCTQPRKSTPLANALTSTLLGWSSSRRFSLRKQSMSVRLVFKTSLFGEKITKSSA